MAIDRVGPRVPGQPAMRSGTASAGSFPPPAEPGLDTARTAQVATSAPVVLESLLSLQQVEGPTERDHSARRRGQALLGALARLQRRLLEDADPTATLEEIRGLADAVPLAADAGLAAAVDLVVLRARIELARRGR